MGVKTVTTEENLALGRMPSEDEIVTIVKSFQPWKASGHDGIPIALILKYWSIIKHDMCDLF